MVAYGRNPDDFPAFLEAGVFPFKVLDVASQFFDHGNEVLVVSNNLGVIHHRLL